MAIVNADLKPEDIRRPVGLERGVMPAEANVTEPMIAELIGAKDRIGKATEKFETEARQIVADPDLNEEGKARRIAAGPAKEAMETFKKLEPKIADAEGTIESLIKKVRQSAGAEPDVAEAARLMEVRQALLKMDFEERRKIVERARQENDRQVLRAATTAREFELSIGSNLREQCLLKIAEMDHGVSISSINVGGKSVAAVRKDIEAARRFVRDNSDLDELHKVANLGPRRGAMTRQEKVAYIQAHGDGAFLKLPI